MAPLTISPQYRRQASGREMVPNVDFWASLPGLVKVRIAFSSLLIYFGAFT